MVLGIWDYIENKIEVSSLTLCSDFQADNVLIFLRTLRTALGSFVTDLMQIPFNSDKYAYSSHCLNECKAV